MLLASGRVAALVRLVRLGVLNRTPRGALRKAACRAGGLEEMTITSQYAELLELADRQR